MKIYLGFLAAITAIVLAGTAIAFPEFFLIYLMMQLDVLISAASAAAGLIVGLVMFAVVGAVVTFGMMAEEKEQPIAIKWYKNICSVLICIVATGCVLKYTLPTSKDMAIIVGSGVAYNVITSDTSKRIGGKAVELLEAKISELLDDTDHVNATAKAAVQTVTEKVVEGVTEGVANP